MITTDDIQALISFYIINNKKGVIVSMISNGYVVPNRISDEKLFFAVDAVYKDHGLTALKNVFKQVKIDESKITEEQAKAIAIKFGNANPNAKFKDWFNNAITSIGDFIGGSTDVVQGTTTTTQQTTPALPTWIPPSVAIIAMAIIAFLFSKGIKNALAISIVIGAIAISVIVAGFLAKKTVLSQTGGGGTSTVHGGVGDALFNWVGGIISGIGGLFGGGGNGGDGGAGVHEGSH